MTGLDKIIGDIRGESAETVDAILKEAEKKAAEIRTKAEAEAGEIREKIRKENETKAADADARANSAAELSRRKQILNAKQGLISDVMDEALKQISSLPDETYFDAVIRMAVSSAHRNEAGEIEFCGRDLKRIPSGFEAKLAAALPQGAKLSVSKKAADIGSGFLLSYGGIEENCSMEALFAARKEELQDKVRGILFP
jgi:V/A-type H+-transporting ATPase subunit E